MLFFSKKQCIKNSSKTNKKANKDNKQSIELNTIIATSSLFALLTIPYIDCPI